MTLKDWHDGEPQPSREVYTDQAAHDMRVLIWPFAMKLRQTRGPDDELLKAAMAFCARCEKLGKRRKR